MNDIIPEGLKFLKGPRQPEKVTIKVLDECCDAHPNGCGHEEHCKYIYAIRCNNDPRNGGWHWGYKNIPRICGIPWRPDVVKYSDTIPQLSFMNVKERIRQNMLGGLQ